MWPLAIGYYVVMLILLFLILALVYYFLWGRKKRQLKKSIRAELLHIEAQYLENGDVALVQAKISALIKRLVFFKYGDKYLRSSDLLSLSEAIKKILPGKRTDELVRLLSKERFQKNPQTDGQLLLNLAREQIKRCRI